MAGIDESFIEEVKSKNDIVDVVSSYAELRRYNDSYKGLCPFHSEKTPSFTVNEKNQYFKCFGCGEGGDVISFVMKKEQMEFMEALKYLADRAGIPWPKESVSEEEKQNLRKKQEMLRLHTETARFYFASLWSGRNPAFSYLRERGLQERTIKRFGLGYASPDSNLQAYLAKKGFDEQLMIDSGLFVGEKKRLRERFFSRIIFPIFDIRGRVIAFGGRVLGEGIPKYLNSPETPIFHKKENLYGLNLARQKADQGLLLAEGYMDVIRLHERGFDFAVASLGTALSKEQAEKIKRYSRRVYLAYDSDEAGKKAALRAIEILKEQDISPYVLDMGENKDPDEFISEHGEQSFQGLIDNAVSSLQFENELVRKKYDLSSDQDQTEFIKEITKSLKKHKNAVEVEKEIRRISEMTGISVKAIGTEVYGIYFSPRQFQTSSAQRDLRSEPIPVPTKDAEQTQMNVLYGMYRDEQMRRHALSILSEEDFSFDRCREIFRIFLTGRQKDIESIEEFQGKNLKYRPVEDEMMKAMIRFLRKSSVKNRIKKLQSLQASLDISNPENHRRLLEIGLEITELNKAIKTL